MTRVPFLEFKDLEFTGDDLTGVSGVGLGYISWEGLKDHLQDLAEMLRDEREKSAKLQADLDAVAMDLGQAEMDKAALAAQDGAKPPARCPETWEGSDAFPGSAA